MMRRRGLTLLLLAAAGAAQAQVPELMVENASPVAGAAAGSQRVRAYVTPLEPNGRVATGLTRKEFQVAAGGRPVAIRQATAAPLDAPGLAVLLLIDTSGSMRGGRIAAARTAAAGFARRLRREDRLALITFDETARLRFDFDTDRARATAALQSVTAGRQNTALFDAVNLARRVSWGSRPGRRAIVLLTDGQDTASALKADDIVRLAQQGTPIHAIALGADTDSRTLRRLAAVSGGAFLQARTPGELGALYEAIRQRLADGYQLEFDLPDTGSAAKAFQVTWLRRDGHRITEKGRVRLAEAATPVPVPKPQPRPKSSPWPLIAVVGGLLALLAVAVGLRLRQAPEPPLALEEEKITTNLGHPGVMLEPPLPANAWPDSREGAGSGGSGEPRQRPTMVQHPVDEPAMAWFYAVAGPLKGRQFPIHEAEAILGRGQDASVSLADDAEVSRRHAKLARKEDGRFFIVDMASTNGIQLNGEPVYQADLRDGDRITLGTTELVFKAIEEKETTDGNTG